MPMQNLEDLFFDKLKDIYDAEHRITRALPKMAKTASSPELQTAFQDHLEQTRQQIERLDRIFENLERAPRRKPCHGMMGILEEGQEVMEHDAPEAVMDAALISGAQEVEHYEIGAYGCLKTWAEVLGRREDAQLLEETLREEEETDQKLSQLASSINARAAEGRDQDEEEQMVGTGSRSGRGKGHASDTTRTRRG